jgi:hypothetical protein
MLAAFCLSNSEVSFVIAVPQEHHLTARVVQRVFHPRLADGFNGEKAADRKLLRHQHAFQGTDGVSKDEDSVAIDKVIRGERVQSGKRAAHSQM